MDIGRERGSAHDQELEVTWARPVWNEMAWASEGDKVVRRLETFGENFSVAAKTFRHTSLDTNVSVSPAVWRLNIGIYSFSFSAHYQHIPLQSTTSTMSQISVSAARTPDEYITALARRYASRFTHY